MSQVARYAKLLLLLLTLLYAALMARTALGDIATADGIVNATHTSPVGGDYINMFAAGRMVLEGRSAEIYVPEAFMAYERGIVPYDIGVRLWAYPPHSLLAVWPFGLADYWTGLALWSLLGLAVLLWGARRAGFDWIETAIIVLSPAALASVYFGQTGNLAAGLLLLALSAGRGNPGGPIAAALLTLKPQAGFLLPVVWLAERKWSAILIAGALTLALAAISLLLFGIGAWRDYLGPTLGLLNTLEREGSGPFMDMIPSVFIALRILAGDATMASYGHAAIAVAAGAFAVWALLRARDDRARWAIAIAAMALITPYLHIYDLAPLLAAALIVVARWQTASAGAQLAAIAIAVAAWALPVVTLVGNAAGVPLGPLVIVFVLGAAALGIPSGSPVPAAPLTEKSPS